MLIRLLMFGEVQVNETWKNGLSSEYGYWWWQIKNTTIGKGEMAGRDSPLKPFDPFIESLIQTCGPDGVVNILDVGAGPLSPLGEVSDHVIKVTAVDALAVAYNKELDERCVGIGSPLRSKFGLAEQLDEIFAPETFDGVVCFNALDHCADPAMALQQMVRLVKPGGFVYLTCWINEGVTEKWRGLHQWNFNIENKIPVIWGRTRQIPVLDFFKGFKTETWLSAKRKKLQGSFLARKQA
jgi:SAM-dependent methyltransferase